MFRPKPLQWYSINGGKAATAADGSELRITNPSLTSSVFVLHASGNTYPYATYREADADAEAINLVLFRTILDPDDLRLIEGLEQLLDSEVARREKEGDRVKHRSVGTVGRMPGTPGFTLAVFRADDVPDGTELFVEESGS